MPNKNDALDLSKSRFIPLEYAEGYKAQKGINLSAQRPEPLSAKLAQARAERAAAFRRLTGLSISDEPTRQEEATAFPHLRAAMNLILQEWLQQSKALVSGSRYDEKYKSYGRREASGKKLYGWSAGKGKTRPGRVVDPETGKYLEGYTTKSGIARKYRLRHNEFFTHRVNFSKPGAPIEIGRRRVSRAQGLRGQLASEYFLNVRTGRLLRSFVKHNHSKDPKPWVALENTAKDPSRDNFPYAKFWEFEGGRPFIRSALMYILNKKSGSNTSTTGLASAIRKDTPELIMDKLIRASQRLHKGVAGEEPAKQVSPNTAVRRIMFFTNKISGRVLATTSASGRESVGLYGRDAAKALAKASTEGVYVRDELEKMLQDMPIGRSSFYKGKAISLPRGYSWSPLKITQPKDMPKIYERSESLLRMSKELDR